MTYGRTEIYDLIYTWNVQLEYKLNENINSIHASDHVSFCLFIQE